MKAKDSFAMKAKSKNKKITKIKPSVKPAAEDRRKEIIEFYYMIPQKTDAKAISLSIDSVPQEKIEVWRELNLLEVVLNADSLIFQDAAECFEDPLDLAYIREHRIETIYLISYDRADEKQAVQVLAELLGKWGGIICSDTDDFEPSYTAQTWPAKGDQLFL